MAIRDCQIEKATVNDRKILESVRASAQVSYLSWLDISTNKMYMV